MSHGDAVKDISKPFERERITFDPSHDAFILYAISPSAPHREAIDAFTAKRCLQKSNYITERVARRLDPDFTRGIPQVLVWRSSKEEPNLAIRRSEFMVISDDAMDTEVALGTECLIGETVLVNPQLKDQVLDRLGEDTSLSTQSQGGKEGGLQLTLESPMGTPTPAKVSGGSRYEVKIIEKTIIELFISNSLRNLNRTGSMTPKNPNMQLIACS
ncbi:hypothetical protein F4805DRAFT_460107 [Annulohypoxylon moriforme]|nr:hypothetical protein F4805DRAFT_460107 [Annulohypoxylon moriforme]